jgi:hypothetical protein
MRTAVDVTTEPEASSSAKPRAIRIMAAEGGVPKVGETATTLGVRAADIEADDKGQVGSDGTQGMSVRPNLAAYPATFLPKRLREKGWPNAAGSNNGRVFRLGEGAFVKANVGDHLVLVPDGEAHGVIAPSHVMQLDDYRKAIVATRESWVDDEP